MRFSFVTLFEDLIKPYFEDSILKRALDRSLFEVDFYNPRTFTQNRHHKVDDIITGGGAGMALMCQPMFDLLESIRSNQTKIIFLSPAGKVFNTNDAKRFATFEHLVLVCGRYEGFDERIIECYADEVISIGDFVLTGGELAALVVADSTLRQVDGVLGNSSSLSCESFEDGLLEAPTFTKPTNYNGIGTPSALLGGNHKQIDLFRKKSAIAKTKFFRPDLYRYC